MQRKGGEADSEEVEAGSLAGSLAHAAHREGAPLAGMLAPLLLSSENALHVLYALFRAAKHVRVTVFRVHRARVGQVAPRARGGCGGEGRLCCWTRRGTRTGLRRVEDVDLAIHPSQGIGQGSGFMSPV